MEIKVLEENIRLDKYLANVTDYTRSKIQKLILDDRITVNGKKVSSNYKVELDDLIQIDIDTSNTLNNLLPSDIEVDIIYEDDDLLVINKKSGMVVHPAPGNYKDTLVNALIGKYELSNNDLRPGIVHRLDKDTSGLMLVAKNDYTHDKLSNMIASKEVEREYLAVVEGTFDHETGTIDAPIGRNPKNREKMMVTSIQSKNAITHFKVLERFNNCTLISCLLETGRTHQIRVHMKYINHPIINDPLYGHIVNYHEEFGQLLHSHKIKFTHPRTREILEFEVEPPQEFMDILNIVVNK